MYEDKSRSITLSPSPISSSLYSNNKISLSPYSYSNFIPKSIFFQFCKQVHICLLIQSIILIYPSLSLQSVYSTGIPFLFLVLFNLLKDFLSFKSFKSKEDILNNSEVLVWNGTNFELIPVKSLLVGQIVKVYGTEKAPADILVLYSNCEDGNFYVECDGNIGKADLKIQVSVSDTQSLFETECSEIGIENLLGKVLFNEPNNDYSNFKGILHLDKNPKVVNLSSNNMFYRNNKLVKTNFIIGVVIYAGMETKLFLNITPQKFKENCLDKKVGYFILVLIIFYVFLVVCSSIMTISVTKISSFLAIQYYVGKFSMIVPSYILIYIDVIRLLQTYFIKFSSKKKCVFEKFDVNENLGNIEYIVTSSAGTLTESLLQVKVLFIGPSVYSSLIDIDLKDTEENEDCSINVNSKVNTFSDLRKNLSDSQVKFFFIAMGLCNSVTMHKTANREYFSLSKEELAMTAMCKDFKIQLTDKQTDSVSLKISKENIRFPVLACQKGRNNRILIDLNGKLTLFVRGSFDRLKNSIIIDESCKESVLEKLSNISNKGYQVFLLAKKELSETESSKIIQELLKNVHLPAASYKNTEKLFRVHEKNLEYLGAIGLEDFVSAETQQSLSSLRESGVKIIVASAEGKFSTLSTCKKAGIFSPEISCASFCHITSYKGSIKALSLLISKHIYQEDEYTNKEILNIVQNKEENIEEILSILPESCSLSQENSLKSDNSSQLYFLEESFSKILRKKLDPDFVKFNLVVDKKSLNLALSFPLSRKLLACLIFAAQSVCFVKMTSKDKSDIVELVKDNLKFRPRVLAVGDKEADIPMIQKADIGVCVKSDSAETRCYADVIIDSISDCKDLVLFYGKISLSGTSKVFMLGVFKNILVSFFLYLQLYFSGFSMIETFESYYFLFFNQVITCLPEIAIGILSEKEIGKIRFFELNWKRFLGFFVSGLANSLVVYLCFFYSFREAIEGNGKTSDLSVLGNSVFVVLVLNTIGMEFVISGKYHSLIACSLALSLCLLSIILVCGQKFESVIETSTYEIMNSPVLFLAYTGVSVLCCMINYFVFLAIDSATNKKARSRLDQYRESLESVYSPSKINKEVAKDIYELNPIKMRFYLSHIEKAYRERYTIFNIKYLKLVIFIFVVFYIIWTIIELPAEKSNHLVYILIRTILGIALIFLTLLTRTVFFKNHYKKIILILFASYLVFKFSLEITNTDNSVLLTAITPSLTYIFFNFDWLNMTILNTANVIIYIILVLNTHSDIFSENIPLSIRLVSIFTLLSIFITLAVLSRTFEKTNRLQFKFMRLQEITYEKTQRILGILLPGFVKKKVKDGVRYFAEDQGTVTVVFCDINDFDSIIGDYSCNELISFLDSLWHKLDLLCSVYGVNKIETVGKTYMACSGLKDSEIEMESAIIDQHHSKRAVSLAFAIIEESKKFVMKNGSKVEFKIGIHSGPVVAGVVGYHKPQFSLVGDTVNTASRMCSTLETSNAIQISGETYINLSENMSQRFVKSQIFAKGKGSLVTYIYSNNALEPFSREDLVFSKTFSHQSEANTEKNEIRLMNRDRGMLSFLDETFRMDTVYLESSKCCYWRVSETDKERRFRIDKLESNKELMNIGLGVSFCYFFGTLCLFLLNDPNIVLKYSEIFALRTVSLLLGFFILMFFKKLYKQRGYGWAIYSIILSSWADLLLIQYHYKYNFDIMTMNSLYIILLLTQITGFSYILIIWLIIPLFFSWLAFAFYQNLTSILLSKVLFVLVFSAINIIAVYIRENQLRNYFNLKALTEKDMKKTEKLLVQMIPPHVLENMKNNKNFTDRLYDVTLLYADIVGFTNWSSDKSPTQVIEMLSNVFTRFDKLCVVNNVYKVHTIGDCYVVMGYLDSKKRDPYFECHSVVNMALSMCSVISRVNREQNTNLSIRIGIHTGNVIAGIIGTSIVRYDIYGPDVLIANKMESSGEPGKINISEVTKRFLHECRMGDYTFTPNKEILLKTINMKYMSYFLGC